MKRRRVLAYITRERNDRTEPFVFSHRDYPEVGVQVPAGRLESNEELEAGLRREIEEEAGLTSFPDRPRAAEVRRHYPSRYENHGFHVVLDEEAPDEWEHVVVGQGDDAGLVFRYLWVPLEPDPHLFGRPHPSLRELA